MAFRIGKAKAITATARKLAILVYRTLKDHFVYVDPGADAYDAQHRTRIVCRLRQRPEHLGLAWSTWRPVRSSNEFLERLLARMLQYLRDVGH